MCAAGPISITLPVDHLDDHLDHSDSQVGAGWPAQPYHRARAPGRGTWHQQTRNYKFKLVSQRSELADLGKKMIYLWDNAAGGAFILTNAAWA